MMAEDRSMRADGAAGHIALSARWRRLLAVCAVVALAWLVAGRVFGPSDLWDQTQPKTVSYTTDIIAHGRWILPVERGEFPATKPPLYNWLAAPAVWLMGFNSEIGHKLPSIVALFACWAALIVLGDRLFPSMGAAVGYLASMCFVSSYTIFKLGYLARPDMLLTLWLVLGWIAATKLLVDAREEAAGPPTRRFLLKLAFWLCVALAGLTKGPVAAVLPVYAVIAGKVITGRWRASAILGWWWGLPASLILVALWIWGVWLTNPEHLRQELWYNEIWGRVTGTGPEGSHEGPLGWLKGLGHMPLYYLVRFAPWSILSILAMVELWKHDPRKESGQIWRGIGRSGYWLMSAAVMVFVVVGLFTLSASKRADYIAAAFAPGSLLAAWWLLRAGPRLGEYLPWLASAAVGVCLGAMTVVNQRQSAAPEPGFGDQIMAFARQARAEIENQSGPVVFWNAGASHLQAMLGASELDCPPSMPPARDDPVLRARVESYTAALRRQIIEDGRPFWLLEGRATDRQMTFARWLQAENIIAVVRPQTRSAELPRGDDWPEQ
ncbi:MAG: hypothetical protein JSV91_14825, partial [Phycisphaerales bacterium]